jgi:hypothetical protein
VVAAAVAAAVVVVVVAVRIGKTYFLSPYRISPTAPLLSLPQLLLLFFSFYLSGVTLTCVPTATPSDSTLCCWKKKSEKKRSKNKNKKKRSKNKEQEYRQMPEAAKD